MSHRSHMALAACLLAGAACAQNPAPMGHTPGTTPGMITESRPATAPAPATVPAPARTAAATATPADAPARKPNHVTSKDLAPGGAPNLVWANSHTKRYHCYGGKYYGRTYQGAYTDETEAIEDGYKPSNGKGCSP